MSKYYEALEDAMTCIAATCGNAVFMGQGVCYPGHGMFKTLRGVPDHMRLELPVFEDTQMGMAIGMALNGYLPVCIFPRWDFLLCAANQLVNHLDKLPVYSRGVWRPKMLIRVAVGAKFPLFPGAQHVNDHTMAFRMMLNSVEIVELPRADDVIPAYRDALDSDNPTILVEQAFKYQED